MRWQKEHVERLVGRLQLREEAKDRLREELWGHLSALYAEAVADGASVEESRRIACRALGMEETLERVFLCSLSPGERMEAWLFNSISCAAELRRRCLAFTVWGTFGLLMLFMACSGLPGMTAVSTFVGWLTASMLVAQFSVAVAIVGYEAGVRRAEKVPRAFGLRLWIYLAALSCTGAGVWLMGFVLAVPVCHATGQVEMLKVVTVFGWTVLLPMSMALAGACPFIGWGIAAQENRARKLPDWPYFGAGRVRG